MYGLNHNYVLKYPQKILTNYYKDWMKCRMWSKLKFQEDFFREIILKFLAWTVYSNIQILTEFSNGITSVVSKFLFHQRYLVVYFFSIINSAKSQCSLNKWHILANLFNFQNSYITISCINIDVMSFYMK